MVEKKKRGGLANLTVNMEKVKDVTLGEVFSGMDLRKVPCTSMAKKMWELIKARDLKNPTVK